MKYNVNREFLLNTSKEILSFNSPTGFCFEIIDKIEEKISKTNDLLDKMLYHLSLEEMAFDMFWDVGVKPLETVPMQYKCDCSRERFESGLISLGKKELLSLAAENRNTEVCCRFCNKKYVFTPEEINQLAKGI